MRRAISGAIIAGVAAASVVGGVVLWRSNSPSGASPRSTGAGSRTADPALVAGWETDFTRHLVPLSEFHSGGPGKDGIPALDHPRFATASAIRWLASREPVIDLAVGG